MFFFNFIVLFLAATVGADSKLESKTNLIAQLKSSERQLEQLEDNVTNLQNETMGSKILEAVKKGLKTSLEIVGHYLKQIGELLWSFLKKKLENLGDYLEAKWNEQA